MKFGRPLDFSRYEGMSEDRFILRSITDEIMYAIMELSGQEYVDLYAPSAKQLAAKQKAKKKRTRSPRRPDVARALVALPHPQLLGLNPSSCAEPGLSRSAACPSARA